MAYEALEKYAPHADLVELGENHESYFRFLSDMWAIGETFLNIEQDIEIHEEVVPQLESCPEPWCAFGYFYGYPIKDTGQIGILYKALGCTKFSAELMQAVPDLMTDLPVKHWRRIDSEMLPSLVKLGYEVHVHKPPVSQHHVYGTRCSCLREHEAYPIDNEGRYSP